MPDMPKIVAIGDSLTQGFMSGAISRTEISFPAMVARSLGVEIPDDFRVPVFPGPGLPLNIEDFLDFVAGRVGGDIRGKGRWLYRIPMLYREYAGAIEELYERGAGSQPTPSAGPYHNLAVWGFRVHDSYSVTPDFCEKAIKKDEGWLQDDFLGLPSGPMYRTARRVLNPRGESKLNGETQISRLEHLAKAEGVDALILFLGANDCLGTALSLELKEPKDVGGKASDNPIRRRRWTLNSAKLFKQEYQEMADRVDQALAGSIGPEPPKVFVGTVPLVTIPPITRGLDRFDGKYFERYGRFFRRDSSFSFGFGKYLDREEVVRIEQRIEEFNDVIRSTADERGWLVVDTFDAMNKLAVRRNHFQVDPGQALRSYYASMQITDHPLLRLDPIPSILRLATREGGERFGGGIFSLDCVHPTTIGYGVIAELFLREMQRAGIKGADPQRLRWDEIIAQDTLIHVAPATWDDFVEAASQNQTIWEALFRIIG